MSEGPSEGPTPARTRRLERNLRLLSVFRLLQMAMFPIAITPLYWRDELGFAMADVFLVQALFGLFAAVLEFPGGYVADRIGYRTAMGVATLCSMSGWVVLGLADGFYGVVFGDLLLAFSLSLTSGTDSALMYESLIELDREPDFGRWFGRAQSLGAAGEGTAALAAGVLFAIWPPLPFFLQAAVWVANAGLVFAMVEPSRHVHEDAGTWKRVRAIFHFAAVRSPQLRATIATGLVFGLSTFVPVWMIAVHAEDSGLPVAWIGPMWAVANYAVAIGTWASDRVGARIGLSGALVTCALLIGAGFFGLGLTHAVWGFAFYYLICLGRGLNGPVLAHVRQRLIPSSDRASLSSIQSMLFRASFFVVGPFIGIAVDRVGEHQVFLVSGLVLAPACLLAAFWLARWGEGGLPPDSLD